MFSMRWSNVLLIFRREVRDQLRDRRTLFMIFVLPILLYPILGIGLSQLATAFEQKPRRVIVIGAESLPKSPPLLNARGDGFDASLFELKGDAERLRITTVPDRSGWSDPGQRRERLRAGDADVVVAIPPNVREQLGGLKRASIPIYFD